MIYSTNSLPPIKLIPINDESEDQHLQGKTSRVKAIPLSDIRWVKVQEFLGNNHLSANSRKLYQRELKRFLDWTELPYHELRPRHIVQYKEYLITEARTERVQPLSKSSINVGLATLRSFFKWVVYTYPEILETNPTLGIKLEKLTLPSIQTLSREQIQRIWEALELLGETKQRDTVLIHILSHGLRAGEVVNLKVESFDGSLLLLPNVSNSDNGESRLVPLREESQSIITNYLRSRQEQGENLHSCSPLLLSHHHLHKGKRLSYHGIYFAVEKIGEIAEISNLHPHAFRHTYTQDLLSLGLDPSHVRQLTGHQSERIFQRYMGTSQQKSAISAYYQAMGMVDRQQ
jgi:integrase/recombinase XerD